MVSAIFRKICHLSRECFLPKPMIVKWQCDAVLEPWFTITYTPNSVNITSAYLYGKKMQGAYKNDLLGLEFDPMVPGEPKLKGSYIIEHMFKIPLDHNKWWDLAALLVILIAYRITFFIILKLKERASPWFWSLLAKRTLHRLNKRPSIRKKPSFPSMRHQPLHSLSSQEGLSSPIP